MVELDDLLAESDFITVHLPKNKDTLGLIGDEALHKVKPTVHIVNAARGGIVDEQALFDALVDGRVAGAGLDVYAKEPCTDSPLFTLDNVVATPHLGASTDEAQEKAGVAVARSVRQALAGQLVPDAVNVRGGVIAEPVRPYLELTEHLGLLATALAPAPVSRVDVEVLGELAEFDVSILELAALKGMFSVVIDEPVSYVNAPVLAGDRGVQTSLTTEGEYDDHRALVKVTVSCSDGCRLSVAGTVAGLRDEPKLVEIDDAAVDVPVSDHMLVFRYADKPGVVGTVGGGLGEAGVNIANMQVSRTDDAVTMVLSVDTSVDDGVVDLIAASIGATIARAVDLGEE